MDFWEFPDSYSIQKKLGLVGTRPPVRHYDGLIVISVRTFGIEGFGGKQYNQLTGERNWYLSNKTYVKVWPQMAKILSDTTINIPTEHLQPPFDSFCIRLPKGNQNPMRESASTPELRSILVCTNNTIEAVGDTVVTLEHRQMMLWLDYGEEVFMEEIGINSPHYSFLTIPLRPGEKFSDVLDWIVQHIDGPADGNTGYMPGRGFLERILALTIATTFMLAGRGREHPDIMARYKDRWEKAKRTGDEKEKKVIIEQSRKRGYTGYRLGDEIEKEIRLFSYRGPSSVSDDSPGRKLNHRHWRGWHLNYYWVGTGKDKRLEARLIEGQWIREDLPLPPGYVIKDNLL